MKRRRTSQQARSRLSVRQPAKGRVRVLALAALLGLGLVAALGYFFWGPGRPSSREDVSGSSEPRLSLGEPPVDAAKVLGLPHDPPQTVEGFKEESLATARHLVESLPDRPESYAQMAFAHLQVGQDRAALESWRKALEKDEKYADAYLGMGAILKDLGEDEQATTSFRKTIELNPEQDQGYRGLTEVLLRQRKAEEALPVARECVRRFPTVPENHFWLGQTYLQLENYAEARRSHEEAIRLDPDFTLSYYPLTTICARLGKKDDAARYRERFAVLKSAELETDRNRARAFDDLATQRQAVVKRHVLAGSLELQFGDFRRAEAHWLRAAAIAPDDLATRKALAILYEQQGRAGAALQFAEELIRLEPDNPEHLVRKGRLLIGLGSEPEGKQTLERALEISPDSAEAHLLLAETYLRTGSDLEAAASHAEKAVSLAASSRSLLLLAAVRGERGDHSGALAALKQAMSLDPENPQIRQAYEQLLATE
jgi:tetratricopeptide (TPR) repeat protein